MDRMNALLLVGLVAALAGADILRGWEPARTPDGKPVLDGVWTNASLTGLERPTSIPNLVLTSEEAERLAGGHFHNVRAAKDAIPSDPNKQAPEALERLPPVGNYNAGWVEPGTSYGIVGGEIRSSWLTEPADGRVPLRPVILGERQGLRERREQMAGPEALSLGERCLLGFGGTGGPPMLNVLYNNYYRIVQTPRYVMILVEMVHDARIIRLDREHGPRDDLRWMGDSTGHWEGDTLVVHTTNFHPARADNGRLSYSSGAEVVERFTRVSEDSIRYDFEIEDPTRYAETMAGEMTFRGVDDKIYEYACHEGNYAMTNILKGARLRERLASGEP